MKKVLVLAAVSEAATGLALLMVPSLVGRLLLGEGLAISWPGHIKDAGAIRNQFHHVIDMSPQRSAEWSNTTAVLTTIARYFRGTTWCM